ncbi:uncharacterized protein LOC136078070 isoform X1 [Hydra vulgaris]|uniref:Uncharacterized protein LOC136078070 isoform X1 n=2 Tax=Hydra vulgaris TaxID=6087 RepID=A0ABM4BIV1_HYDVU
MNICSICQQASFTCLSCALCTNIIDTKCQGSTLGEYNVVCKTCADSVGVVNNMDATVVEVFKRFTKNELEDFAASSTMKMIFSGTLHSFRHNNYKAGGSKKKNLSDFELVSLLSEDQSNCLYLALGSNFRDSKFNDYIYKVIVPKCIISLFAKLMLWSRIQAEVFLNKFFTERRRKSHLIANNYILQIKSGADDCAIGSADKSDICLLKNNVTPDTLKDSMKTEMMKAVDNNDFNQASKLLSKLKTLEEPVSNYSRRKVKCPACEKSVVDLKRHLMSKKHDWDESKAKSARINFDLNLKRKVLSPSKRHSKIRNYKQTICGFLHCSKEVKRINNHLRQYHGLKSKEEIKKALLFSRPVLETFLDENSDMSSNDGVSSESLAEDDLLENNFNRAIHNDNNFLCSDSDDENQDWLSLQYLDKRLPKSSNSFQAGHSKSNLFNVAGTKNEKDASDSDESNIDFDDGEDKFYMTSSEEDKLLDEFLIWLQSVEGGIKPLRTALKHKNVVLGAVRHATDDDVNYKHLGCVSFLNSWMLKMQEDKKQPGTIKTYLGSLQLFLDFCISKEKLEIISNEEYSKLKISMKQWKRSLWKGIQERQHEKDMDDFHNFPSSEEINALDKSDYVKCAKDTIKASKSSSFVITKSNYCLVRSYLLAYTILNNATRPGASANMTIGEFRRALYKENCYTISIKKHKTSYKGPANIVLTFELYNELNTYIEFFRNKLNGISLPTGTAIVFLSYNGAPMDSSMITSQFHLFWNRALGKKVKEDYTKMTPTLVRKFTTTKVHQNFPSLKQNVAHHLCHSLKVAESNYAIFDKYNAASSTSNQLCLIQRSLTDEQGTKIEEKKNIPLNLFENEINKGSIKVADVKKKLANSSENLCDEKVKKIVDKVRYAIKRKKITQMPNQQLPETEPNIDNVDFVNEISCPLSSSISQEIQKKVYPLRKRKEEIYSIESSNNGESLFYAAKDVDKSEDFNYDDYIPPSPDSAETSFKRSRKEFTKEDRRLIYTHLSNVIYSNEPIMKDKFALMLKKPELEGLVKKFGLQSLIVKMRTERKNNINIL